MIDELKLLGITGTARMLILVMVAIPVCAYALAWGLCKKVDSSE